MMQSISLFGLRIPLVISSPSPRLLLRQAAVARLNGCRTADRLTAAYARAQGITLAEASARVQEYLDLCLE